jgi:hypothetical protein
MTTFSSTQPSLRARILPRFPAQVLAGTGITITKNGGTYVFAVQAYADIPITALASIPADRLLGRDTSGIGPVEILTASGGLGFNGIGSLELTNNQRLRTIPMMFTAPVTGSQQDIMIPFAGTLTRITLMANIIGNLVLDIWKDTYANFPPTLADTITAAAKPTILGGTKYQDSTLAGWNTSVAAGDILRFNVDSVTTITRFSVALDVVTL